MHKYDQIVVGGGTSGLTLAALLGLNGKKVLLLEKGPKVGGSMLRFQRGGVPFDTGVHFSAGLGQDGILTQMLRVLGIGDAIWRDPITTPKDNRFVFEDTGHNYAHPVGIRAITEAMSDYFPSEHDGIVRFFAMMQSVFENTASMQLGCIAANNAPMKTDDVSLADVLDDLIREPELRVLLAGYALCHGTPPDQISFTKHSQVAYGLYDSVGFVGGGGDALINALTGVLSNLDVETRVRTTIAECGQIEQRRAREFVLTTGDVVEAGECLFTVHPQAVMRMLPRDQISRAFVDRVSAFEPSIGLFCLYGTVRSGAGVSAFSPAIVTRLPNADMRTLLQPDGADDRPMAMLKHKEIVNGESRNILTVQEVSEPADVAKWAATSAGRRPRDYYEYKDTRTARMMRRVLAEFPEYEEQLDILASASMLTFRDYLRSPWGCAYGIKQRMGQFNLFGRLPIRNLYAAGQSATLPGVVGAMMSSFIVARMVLGKNAYQPFIDRQLRPSGSTVKVSA
ncbi:MAG: phytoene desaturase family protein [bacterium]